MYSLNGFDLDDNVLGGYLLFESQPYAGINRQSNSFSYGPRDGRIAVPWQNDAPVIALVVRVPVAGHEALEALLNSSSLTLARTDGPDRVAGVELTALAVENLPTADPMVDVRFMLQFNDVYWRSASESTSSAVALADGDETVTVFAGISAPVRDAIIRVRGSVTGLRVEGGNGSWFSYAPNVPSGSYLRFESGTGRAFVTASDTWSGGTEVTGSVLNGAGPYFLELVPSFTDPLSRSAVLRVLTTTRAGSPTVEVRGKNAFLV